MRRAAGLGVAALLLTAALPAGAGALPAPPAKSVFLAADPDAEAIDGELWIFPTEGRSEKLVAWSSSDLASWRQRGTLLTQRDVGWLKDDGAFRHFLWAPDMVASGGRWYLYYSVGPQNPTASRLGVAVCTAPQGPCTDSGRPLLTGTLRGRGTEFEAIDPMVFVDPKSGVRYLYAGGSAGSRLKVFELAADMVTVAREVPVAQPPNFTEGAFMHERGGIYYLSYSAGNWQTASYSVHYATAPSPTGPWTYRGAILESDARYKGPGHHSFVKDPATGATLIVYHRWEGVRGPGPYTGFRRIALAPLNYTADGSIVPVRMNGDDAR